MINKLTKKVNLTKKIDLSVQGLEKRCRSCSQIMGLGFLSFNLNPITLDQTSFFPLTEDHVCPPCLHNDECVPVMDNNLRKNIPWVSVEIRPKIIYGDYNRVCLSSHQ